MYKKIAIAGVTAAAIIGVGTAALAESGSTSGSPSAGSSTASSGSASTTAPAAKAKAARAKGGVLGGKLAKRVVHGQVVTRGKGGTFVTHDIVRGTVASVSSTSIVVTAADKSTETYVVNSATKVRARTAGKGAASTIGSVAKGDTVLVVGTGTGTLTAKHIVDVKK